MNTPESGLIIGAGGGGKGGGGSARVAQEAPDSLRSKAYARVVDLVCEGEIEGLAAGLQSVYLDDTPIQNPDGSYNFTGVTLETRPGTQQQSYIPGFSSVENEVAVGVECKANQPVVRTINDPDVDAVRIKVSIPTLTLQDTTNGDLNGTSVSYAIDVQAHGAGYVQILADTVSGKTTSRYQRSYYIPLTGTGPWDVRLRRITADSTQTSLQNKTFLESYTEVIESKLRYPNSALMALRVDASQFTSIPRRSYDLKLLRVRIPSNYFPETRSYAGVWDGIKPKTSPPSPVARSVHSPAFPPSRTTSRLSPGLPKTSPIRNLPRRLLPAGNRVLSTDSRRSISDARNCSRVASVSLCAVESLSLKSSIRRLSFRLCFCFRLHPSHQLTDLEADHLADAVMRQAKTLALFRVGEQVDGHFQAVRCLACIDQSFGEDLISVRHYFVSSTGPAMRTSGIQNE